MPDHRYATSTPDLEPPAPQGSPEHGEAQPYGNAAAQEALSDPSWDFGQMWTDWMDLETAPQTAPETAPDLAPPPGRRSDADICADVIRIHEEGAPGVLGVGDKAVLSATRFMITYENGGMNGWFDLFRSKWENNHPGEALPACMQTLAKLMAVHTSLMGALRGEGLVATRGALGPVKYARQHALICEHVGVANMNDLRLAFLDAAKLSEYDEAAMSWGKESADGSLRRGLDMADTLGIETLAGKALSCHIANGGQGHHKFLAGAVSGLTAKLRAAPDRAAVLQAVNDALAVVAAKHEVSGIDGRIPTDLAWAQKRLAGWLAGAHDNPAGDLVALLLAAPESERDGIAEQIMLGTWATGMWGFIYLPKANTAHSEMKAYMRMAASDPDLENSGDILALSGHEIGLTDEAAARADAERATLGTEPVTRATYGARVYQLQAILYRDYGVDVGMDFVFGDGTAAAVRTVQEQLGMAPTGVADTAFLEAIQNGEKPMEGPTFLENPWWSEPEVEAKDQAKDEAPNWWEDQWWSESDVDAKEAVPDVPLTGSPLLYVGIEHPQVRTLKRILRDDYGESLPVDAVFDQATAAAVSRCQVRAGIYKDGKVGSDSAKAFNARKGAGNTGLQPYQWESGQGALQGTVGRFEPIEPRQTRSPEDPAPVSWLPDLSGLLRSFEEEETTADRRITYPHAGALTGNPVLAKGSTDPQVRVLQQVLNAQYGEALALTGVYDEETEQAVRRCQTLAGIGVDGKVGSKSAASFVTGRRAANRDLPESTLKAWRDAAAAGTGISKKDVLLDVPFMNQNKRYLPDGTAAGADVAVEDLAFPPGGARCVEAARAMVVTTGGWHESIFTVPSDEEILIFSWGDEVAFEGTFFGDEQASQLDRSDERRMAEVRARTLDGVAYIDAQLDAGKAVAVGVSGSIEVRNRLPVDADSDPYERARGGEARLDHGVTIVGRKGGAYIYYDPGSATGGSGERTFILDTDGVLKTPPKRWPYYEVCTVLKNVDRGPAQGG